MPCLLTALLSLSKLSFPAFASEVAYASRGLAPHYLGRALEEDGHEGHDHGGGGGGDEGPQGMAIRMHSEDPQSFQIDAQLTKGDADEIVVMFKLVEEGAESGHEGHDHGRALEEDDHSGHDHDEGPGVDHDHEFDEMKEKITDDDAMDAACTEVKFGKHLELKFEHEDAEDYRPCFHLEISSSVSVSSYGVKVTTEEEGDLLILAMPVEHHHDEGGGDEDHEEEEEEHAEVKLTIRNKSTGAERELLGKYEDGKYTLTHEPSTYKKWQPWLAGFLVNLVTFAGLIFAVPALNRMMRNSETSPIADEETGKKGKEEEEKAKESSLTSLDNVYSPKVLAWVTSFAAGAILACAFLLVLPEALVMIQSVYADESDAAWRWGTPLLFGLVFPFLVTLATDMLTRNAEEKNRLILGILIGDFFHNLTDGTFIAAAFSGCDPSFGWTVMGSTIAHEVAQEWADYLVLTTVCELQIWKACLLNFLSGTGVFIGVAIVMGSDVGNDTIGVLLAFGGGVYIAVGATECMPRFTEYAKTIGVKITGLLFFCFGAVAIGLILLDHKHCETGAHAGHNH